MGGIEVRNGAVNVAVGRREPCPNLLPSLDKIEAIAIEIFEDSDRTVALLGRRTYEGHAARNERVVIAQEIIGLKEHEHSPASLVAYA